MPPLLDVQQLTISFPIRQGDVVTNLDAVRDVSFSIGEGQSLGLVGESGSGKSVTSLAIMRLLPPQAVVRGNIAFAGKELTSASDNDIRALRGSSIAMIFQEPMTALNPVMRVGDQVAEAVLAHHRVSKKEAHAQAVEALRTVAIPDPDRRARDYPHQLSGGQRQRVMIAMAVVNRPKLLIADEPTTALDVTVQAQILDLLADLRRNFGLAMLFISHDLAVVSRVVDRVSVMYAGQIVESGAAREVLHEPLHPYTRGLMNSVPTLKADRTRPLQTIEGTVPAVAALPPGCAFEPRCNLRIAECAQRKPELSEKAAGHWVRCPVAK
ncbi:MAG TPA: ABC transporter ATP-binding protein [Candidatus Acidoferrales bacterium]|nr:ABC transporter ATP-binding protein [Candidatus Acidoferrales bacterium]